MIPVDDSQGEGLSKTPAKLPMLHPRVGKREVDRLRRLLRRPDRDMLTVWEVIEIAADDLTAARVARDAAVAESARLLGVVQAVEKLCDEADERSEKSLSRLIDGSTWPAQIQVRAIRAAISSPADEPEVQK